MGEGFYPGHIQTQSMPQYVQTGNMLDIYFQIQELDDWPTTPHLWDVIF